MTAKQPTGNAAQGGSAVADAVLALTLAYEGSGFCGFARQENQITVQGCLEKALELVYRRSVPTVGAGRTDSGVHALGQVVSFELSNNELDARTFAKLRASLNALTPEQLVIKKVEEKPVGFSARFSAKQREYRYRLHLSPTPPVFMAPYAWWLPVEGLPHINDLKAAAKLLEGEQDFKSFCVAKSGEGKTTMRNISKVHIFGAQHLGEQCVMIQVIGNAFLHSMVRVMVGSLAEVLQGKKAPEWIAEVLAAKDRRAAGQTAPAHGLTLWEVTY